MQFCVIFLFALSAILFNSTYASAPSKRFPSKLRVNRFAASGSAVRSSRQKYVRGDPDDTEGSMAQLIAATLPGDPLVTGTLVQGIANGISLYNNVLLARYKVFF